MAELFSFLSPLFYDAVTKTKKCQIVIAGINHKRTGVGGE